MLVMYLPKNVDSITPPPLQWLSIDPLSGVPPLHTDITRTIRRDSEIQALSMWDREEEFT